MSFALKFGAKSPCPKCVRPPFALLCVTKCQFGPNLRYSKENKAKGSRPWALFGSFCKSEGRKVGYRPPKCKFLSIFSSLGDRFPTKGESVGDFLPPWKQARNRRKSSVKVWLECGQGASSVCIASGKKSLQKLSSLLLNSPKRQSWYFCGEYARFASSGRHSRNTVPTRQHF